MSEFLPLAESLAPTLLALLDRPYWVSVSHPPAGPEVPGPGPALEFWVGPFEYWYPDKDCMAIFAVMPASAFTACPPSALSPWKRAQDKRPLLCAVSREGEAYCAMGPDGGYLVEGTPHSGRLLDVLRSKLGLPPVPPSPYDLAFTVELSDTEAVGRPPPPVPPFSGPPSVKAGWRSD